MFKLDRENQIIPSILIGFLGLSSQTLDLLTKFFSHLDWVERLWCDMKEPPNRSLSRVKGEREV